MKGDGFELSESLFEGIEKSPLSQTLNATASAFSLVWWLVCVPGARGCGRTMALLLVTTSLLSAPVRAQQEPHLEIGLVAQTAAPAMTAPANMASMTVARWTAEPVTAANRADDLLAEEAPPWRVTDGVASVVFQLGAERAVLTSVLIDAGKVPDPPRGVEVLLGTSERGPWRSVASFALEPGDGVRRETLAPSRAGFALLRASGHQPGQATMALTRFRLMTVP